MGIKDIQTSFTGGEITPEAGGRVDLAKYDASAKTIKNFIVHAHGGISNRPGTRFIEEQPTSAAQGRVRLVRFQYSITQAYILELSDLKMRVYKDRGIVLDDNDNIYSIATPWTEDIIFDLNFTQSFDSLFVAHPSYAVRVITRTDHNSWSVTALTYGSEVGVPSTPTAVLTGLSGTGLTIDYVVAAVTASGSESLPSLKVSKVYNGTWAVGDKVTVTLTALATADSYNIYKSTGGAYGYIGRLVTEGSTGSKDFVDNNIDPSATEGPQVARDPFDGADSYPGVVSMHEQRMIFARTNNQPQTIWGSQSGDLYNLNTSYPLSDSDAYEFTLASAEVNEIKYIVPMNKLIILTEPAEWAMTGGSNGGPITPSAVDARVQERRGSASVPPIVIGNAIIFVQRGGSVVRDLFYQLEGDGFEGDNLTILAPHLFKGRSIVDWAYQQIPDNLLWVVLDNGVLLSLTYNRKHKVWAWCQHNSDGGKFESVEVVPAATEDEVYFVVRRRVLGEYVRHIEILTERLPDDELEKGIFLDDSLSLNSPSTIEDAVVGGREITLSVEVADVAETWTEIASSTFETTPNSYNPLTLGFEPQADVDRIRLVLTPDSSDQLFISDLKLYEAIGADGGVYDPTPSYNVTVDEDVDYIPALSSNNGTWTAAADTEASTNEQAWEAFDNVIDSDDNETFWEGSTTGSGYIRVQAPSQLTQAGYSLYPLGSGSEDGTPTKWTYQGSNNGSTWDTLDDKTGSLQSLSAGQNSYEVDDNTLYTYFRLNITATKGSAKPRLAEFEVHGGNYETIDPPPYDTVSWSTDELPDMTSSTTPSGYVVSASSEDSDYYAAWKAFDSSQLMWLSEYQSAPWILQMQLPSAVRYYGYSITYNYTSSYHPQDWIFQGSNNGTSWTNLDSRSGVDMERNEKYSYQYSDTSTFSYYRMYITKVANTDTNRPVTLSDVQFHSGTTTDPDPYTVLNEVYYNTSLIPSLTSNSGGSYLAQADSENETGREAYKCFDSDATGGLSHWQGTTAGSGWLRIEAPSEFTQAKYTIVANDDDDRGHDPKDWNFQASTNGTSWTNIDSQTAQTFTRGQEVHYTSETTTAYKYYRLNITSTQGGDTPIIAEFEIHEGSYDEVSSAYVDSLIPQGLGSTISANLTSSWKAFDTEGATTYAYTESDVASASVGKQHDTDRYYSKVVALSPFHEGYREDGDTGVLITSQNHGLSNGDYVDIRECEGMTELNGPQFTVADATTHTFTLDVRDTDVAVDGSGYGEYIENSGVWREAFGSVSGLGHLEGEAVTILSNGNVITGQIVTAGEVTISAATASYGSIVHVGRPYNSDVETLTPEITDIPHKTLQGTRYRIGQATVRLLKSSGGYVGPDVDNLHAIKFSSTTELFTGDKNMPITAKWGTDGHVFVRQSQPLPMTILSIIPEIDVGDR